MWRTKSSAGLTLLTSKGFPLFVAAACSMAICSTAVAEERGCGTVLSPEGTQQARGLQAAGIYAPPAQPEEPYHVPLTFHVVRRSDGTEGIDDTRLVRALDDANIAFSNSGIRLCWPGPIDYIDDDDFYFNIDTMDEIDALRSTNIIPDTVNVYFTENLANEQGPLCGISSFTFSPVQGVVMANACTGAPDNHSTFPHQLGHYFDLFHTHETAFGPECPACAIEECECSVAGDLLCDTPADPGLGTHNVDTNCIYFGSERDPCSDSPYAPDPTNYMSDSRKACRTTITNQQQLRMEATLTQLRPDLIWDDCPGGNRWNLDRKLTPNDGAISDWFGRSVALSGETALIGAYGDNERGTDDGSAYVYRNVGGVWTQAAKLTAEDGAAGDFFGVSAALSGDTALIGAFQDDDRGTDSGSVYVFREFEGVWTQVAKLTAGDGAAGDKFGYSISLSSGAVLIGAYGDNDDGDDSGSAYVFREVEGAWTQVAKLTADDGEAGDWFGFSVALSGDTALIGAKFDDPDGYRDGTDSGSAYVFRNIDRVWKQVAKLTADDGADGDSFGAAVAISGDTALIGANNADENGNFSGSAYVFREISGLWTQVAKPTAPDNTGGDAFGFSVALSSGKALIGAIGDNDHGVNSGSAYVFHEVGGDWPLLAKLTAPDGAFNDLFGTSVALSAGTGLIGAIWDDDHGGESGATYVFRNLDFLRGGAPGDVDGDGDVDLDDYEMFQDCFTGPGDPSFPEWCVPADLDRDADVDFTDFGAFQLIFTGM